MKDITGVIVVPMDSVAFSILRLDNTPELKTGTVLCVEEDRVLVRYVMRSWSYNETTQKHDILHEDFQVDKIKEFIIFENRPNLEIV